MNIVLFVLIVLLFQICLNPFQYVKNLVYNQIVLLFFQLFIRIVSSFSEANYFPSTECMLVLLSLVLSSLHNPHHAIFLLYRKVQKKRKKMRQTDKKCNFCCRSHTYTLPFLHLFQIIIYWKVSSGCGLTCGVSLGTQF